MILIKEELVNFISQKKGINPSEIKTDQTFRSQGMDSIDIVSLISFIESKNNISIPDDTLYSLTSIDKVLNYLENI